MKVLSSALPPWTGELTSRGSALPEKLAVVSWSRNFKPFTEPEIHCSADNSRTLDHILRQMVQPKTQTLLTQGLHHLTLSKHLLLGLPSDLIPSITNLYTFLNSSICSLILVLCFILCSGQHCAATDICRGSNLSTEHKPTTDAESSYSYKETFLRTALTGCRHITAQPGRARPRPSSRGAVPKH